MRIILVLIFLSLIIPAVLVPFSQSQAAAADAGLAGSKGDAPKSGTVRCLTDSTKQCVVLTNPVPKLTSVNYLIGLIISIAMSVIGSLSLLMLVWGGFKWLTAAGNTERIESGTKTMLWAVIGVIVVLSSYIIVTTFTKYLTGGG